MRTRGEQHHGVLGMKKTIVINDVIPERTEQCERGVLRLLENYLVSSNVLPTFEDLNEHGDVVDLVRSLVPEYSHHLDSAYFLYRHEIVAGGDGVYGLLFARAENWFEMNASEIIFRRGLPTDTATVKVLPQTQSTDTPNELMDESASRGRVDEAEGLRILRLRHGHRQVGNGD